MEGQPGLQASVLLFWKTISKIRVSFSWKLQSNCRTNALCICNYIKLLLLSVREIFQEQKVFSCSGDMKQSVPEEKMKKKQSVFAIADIILSLEGFVRKIEIFNDNSNFAGKLCQR